MSFGGRADTAPDSPEPVKLAGSGESTTRNAPVTLIPALVNRLESAEREIKSLESRISTMEDWGEALERRLVATQSPASLSRIADPLEGNVSSVPASGLRIVKPGGMARAPDGW